MDKFKEGTDYYMEDGRMVLTDVYLTKIRKQCCGNGCRNCPFDTSQKGCTVLKVNVNKKDSD